MRRDASPSHFCLSDKLFGLGDGVVLGCPDVIFRSWSVIAVVATAVVMEAVVGWWWVEGVVVSCPSSKAKGGVPGALQFEAHPRVRAVGLGPVFGKLSYHFLSVALGEGLECVDEALASLFEPFLVTFCRNLLAHARVRG